MTTMMIAPARTNTSAATVANGLRVVAVESGSAPAEIGGTYSKIISASVDDSGDVAFSAALSDSSATGAILLKSETGTRVLVRAGDKAPDGSTYKMFDELDRSFYGYNGAQYALLLFRAELEGGTASEGLFLMKPDSVQTIALAGDKSPRGLTYKTFAQPTLIAERGDRGGGYYLAFLASMEEGRKSIITISDIFAPEELTTGDHLGDREVQDFVISQSGAEAVSALTDMLDLNSGATFKEVVLVGGNIISGSNFRTKARIEPLGKVKKVLSPPAIGFQVSIASVIFKGGVSAVVLRDVLGSTIAVGATGDPALGVSNETLQAFGPPIANVDFPWPSDTPRPPSGIVSAVKLSGGRSALWLWVRRFPGIGFPPPETKLVLLEGDATNDGQVVHNFSPVKLSNLGAVLLRGTVGEGAVAQEGLFITEALF